jgi:hypothetical protein
LRSSSQSSGRSAAICANLTRKSATASTPSSRVQEGESLRRRRESRDARRELRVSSKH